MKKIRYEIPGLLFTFSLLILSIAIEEKIIRYILILVTLLCSVSLMYLIIKEISQYIGSLKTNEDNKINEISNELRTSTEKYCEEQKKIANQLTTVINQFIEASNNYTEKVEELVKIEHSIVEEEKILSEKIQLIDENIHNTLNSFSLEFLDNQKKLNVEQSLILENTADKISGYMKEYEDILINVSNSTNALKSQVKVSLDQVNTAVNNQIVSIEDGFEDCVDEIGDKMDQFNKNQKLRDEQQNLILNTEIKSIENVISKQIGTAMEENKKLLSYIQNVQEEWTTLSKDEIAFLDKVWNE